MFNTEEKNNKPENEDFGRFTDESHIINPENEALNPFEPLFVKTVEEVALENVQNRTISDRTKRMTDEENKKVKKEIETNKVPKMTIQELIEDMSKSLLSLIDELYEKPDNESWSNYLQEILTKDRRMTYLGTLFVILSVFIMFINNNND
jgi:hypothetical protein